MTESPLTVVPVPKEHLDYVWPAASAELARAAQTTRGKFSADDIYAGLLNDLYLLWVIARNQTVIAAFTTRIIEYPQKRAMALDWVGGHKMSEWLSIALDAVRAHANANGCTSVEGYGREAWGRVLSKHGFEPEYIAYRMEL